MASNDEYQQRQFFNIRLNKNDRIYNALINVANDIIKYESEERKINPIKKEYLKQLLSGSVIKNN